MDISTNTILLIACFFMVILFVYYFNTLTRLKNRVSEAESVVDIMLKKKFDVLPNLIQIVKQFMNHEKNLLTRLTELRTQAQKSKTLEEIANVESEFNNLTKNLIITAESYPDLRSSENFLHLQRTVNEVEEQLSAARRSFNAAVTEYNTTIETIPTLFFAAMLGHKRKTLVNYSDLRSKNFSAEDEFNR